MANVRRERLGGADWNALEHSLFERGHALLPRVLSAAECRSLIGLYDRDERFRSTIQMARHGFGEGEYRYFDYPLPRPVRDLRARLYRRLAPIANRWMEMLGRDVRYPAKLEQFIARCRSRGQKRPTPLLLRYTEGGYNCLHQDLYGEVAFPLQAAVFLSRPGKDYGGGEFLLVERRPRKQSIGEAILEEPGTGIIFPSSERPSPGKRGPLRTEMRHGMSRLRWGERYMLGIIFHDAR